MRARSLRRQARRARANGPEKLAGERARAKANTFAPGRSRAHPSGGRRCIGRSQLGQRLLPSASCAGRRWPAPGPSSLGRPAGGLPTRARADAAPGPKNWPTIGRKSASCQTIANPFWRPGRRKAKSGPGLSQVRRAELAKAGPAASRSACGLFTTGGEQLKSRKCCAMFAHSGPKTGAHTTNRWSSWRRQLRACAAGRTRRPWARLSPGPGCANLSMGTDNNAAGEPARAAQMMPGRLDPPKWIGTQKQARRDPPASSSPNGSARPPTRGPLGRKVSAIKSVRLWLATKWARRLDAEPGD